MTHVIKVKLIRPSLHLLRFGFCVLTLLSGIVSVQSLSQELPENVSLTDCIKYALENQPIIQQSMIEEEINSLNIKIGLSDWLPQINANANIQHFFKLPTSILPSAGDSTGNKVAVTTGTINNSAILFSAEQTLFNNEVLSAGLTAKYYRKQARQNTENTKIDLVVNVSKAFYDVMVNQQELQLIDEEIQRLDRNLKDAYSLYQSGLNDKIDYKRATIALNSARTDRKNTEAGIKSKLAYLKNVMGYPPEKNLHVLYDSIDMMKDILLDTLQPLIVNNRIEYKLLQTNLKLQKINVDYYRMAFLPSLSAFADYNLVYQNDNFSDLYLKDYPNSYVGLKLTFPLFQGVKRIENIKKAKLQYNELRLDTLQLNYQFNMEYTQAMATYTSNIEGLDVTRQNVAIAHEVYDLVKMQYEKGIKTYLDVIVSETDLRTAEINELNALFRVLSGKIDVQKALGNIQINY